MVRHIFYQMLSAIGYLHAKRIVHRDIKTENWLMVSPLGSTVKLCDFGTAVQLTDTKARAMERVGTLSYTAPEIYSDKGATTMADMWSMGVILYLLVVGGSAFRHSTDASQKDTVRRIQAG